MSADREDAARLLRRAKADLAALWGMGDAALFDDNIFGFHAQQAVEKAFKSRLAALGREYPFRHDLGELLAALERAGEAVEAWWPLVDLTAFAVQLRYDDVDLSMQLDRKELADTVEALIEEIEKRSIHD